MKVIIAGGRHYKVTTEDWKKLDEISISEVVSGCASGADKGGEYYAEQHGIPVARFSADWQVHGRAAGPIRNRQMAEYAEGVVLFPGGRGTASMLKEAQRTGIKVFDYRR